MSGNRSHEVMTPNWILFKSDVCRGTTWWSLYLVQIIDNMYGGERYINECLLPSAKHGGVSVMVCGYISSSAVGDLVIANGFVNKNITRDFMHLPGPSGKCLVGNSFIFFFLA